MVATASRALLSLDDTLLTVDDLKALSRQIPTPEEIARLRDFGDTSTLAKADQLFVELSAVPRLANRLECMIFRRRLELDVEELRPELDIVRCAGKEMRGGERRGSQGGGLVAVQRGREG